MQRRSLIRATGAAALLSATPFVRAQGNLQKFKFNLGWKIEASGAGFLLAQQRGYYKDAGLDVTVDTGNDLPRPSAWWRVVPMTWHRPTSRP